MLKLATLAGIIIGGALLTVGLILGYGSVHRGGVDCGSPFGGANNNALTRDFTNALEGQAGGLVTVNACSDGLASRDTTAKALVWPGGILAGIGSLSGLLLLGRMQDRNTTKSAHPEGWAENANA